MTDDMMDVALPRDETVTTNYVKLDAKTTWVPAGAVIACMLLVFGFGVAWAQKGQAEQTEIKLLQQQQQAQQQQIDAFRDYMRRNDERWDSVRDDLALVKHQLGIPTGRAPGHTLPASP